MLSPAGKSWRHVLHGGMRDDGCKKPESSKEKYFCLTSARPPNNLCVSKKNKERGADVKTGIRHDCCWIHHFFLSCPSLISFPETHCYSPPCPFTNHATNIPHLAAPDALVAYVLTPWTGSPIVHVFTASAALIEGFPLMECYFHQQKVLLDWANNSYRGPTLSTVIDESSILNFKCT